ncbi:MAG: hypothetical protein ACK4FJ_15650 [Ferrovibrio sp.]|uniref:hypothetical protein n=1 Tax=Ferrovibrio sp. TaxID=1917215 RepID=UPI00391A3B68
MPLETIGSYAVAGSSGAIARGARTVTDSDYSTPADDLTGFAGLSARSGGNQNNIITIPSPSRNVAAYLSPFIRLDLVTRLAIVEIRNSETGEVQQQYPSPRVVREYQQNQIEASELRAQFGKGDQETEKAPVQPVTFDTTNNGAEEVPATASAPTQSAQPAAPAPAPAPPASPIPSAALAAFSSVQNSLTGGRELAVA